MTAPFTVPAAAAADALKDIQRVALHIVSLGDLLYSIDSIDSVAGIGDLFRDLGSRLLCDLESYSSLSRQSSN
jgi:hypothetical protein